MTKYPEHHGKGESRSSTRARNKRMKMYCEQGGACHWCREAMSLLQIHIMDRGNLKDNPKFATFEHLLPKSMGGRGGLNVVLAHATCNRDRPLRKWDHDPIYGKKLSLGTTPADQGREETPVVDVGMPAMRGHSSDNSEHDRPGTLQSVLVHEGQ